MHHYDVNLCNPTQSDKLYYSLKYMQVEPYQRIDVKIFEEILRKKHCSNETPVKTKKALFELVQSLNEVIIKVDGLDIDKKKEVKKINFKEHGFKNINDVNIEFSKDVFEIKNKITLKANTLYELEDHIELPEPIDEKGDLYLLFLADAFERLKIKAENILDITGDNKSIELYAKKNIQKARRIFYDSRIMLERTQSNGNRTDIYIFYVLNIFIINVILYLQKMFSAFYKEEKETKEKLKYALYDSIKLDVLMEPVVEYKNEEKQDDIYFKWNGQINSFIAIFYDLANRTLPNNKILLEVDQNKLVEFMSKHVIDKKGKRFNENTIRTCLKESKFDKRPQGDKRHDIEKYL